MQKKRTAATPLPHIKSVYARNVGRQRRGRKVAKERGHGEASRGMLWMDAVPCERATREGRLVGCLWSRERGGKKARGGHCDDTPPTDDKDVKEEKGKERR